MATKKICDRCGKEAFPFEHEVNLVTIDIIQDDDESFSQDLCKQCVSGLRDYLKPIPRVK